MSAKSVCYVCDLIWCCFVIAGCTWAVFMKGASGWWYCLAIFLCSCWRCNGVADEA